MMDPPDETPRKPRVRLTPWRGPFHFLLLLATSSVTLLLPLLYALLLLALGFHVGALAFGWIEHLALAETRAWRELLVIPYIAVGAVTWVFMLRPLLPRPRSTRVAMQVTPTSQPALFELVDELCWNLRLEPPEEIWLDTTTSVRTSLRNGVSGALTGESVIHVGLPVVSVLGAREFAALVARELAMNTGGLGTTFSHLVRELNTWFYRALHERDPWELRLRQKKEKETRWQAGCRVAIWLWMAAAKLPFAFFVLAARVISAAALMRLGSGADKAGVNLAGRAAWGAMQAKLRLLDAAWESARVEVRRGISQHRLPDNLSLLIARHVARAAGDGCPAEPAGGPEPKGARIISGLEENAPAAVLLRGFVDLSRQLTSFYYQHDLGIQIHEHRLVAEEEVIHQNRREDESLVIIRRYFSGLAHPERAMCGHAPTHAFSPGRERLENEIRRVRQDIREWGSRLKPALQEWNLAWQRRRDLEAAAVLSLGGFNVSRIQFGTEDTSPQSLRQEAARQRMLMEHMETALTAFEAKMESRFAAALGLLWWSAPDELDARLIERRQDLPHWVGLYEAMAGALPSFRELLTTFFAFQTLGARFSSLDDAGPMFQALQSVVPKMINLTRQILSAMDGAQYAFTSNRRPMPLVAHLLPGRLPEPVGISMDPAAAADTKALSAKMAADASEVVAPFVDRFMQLWHKSYAWLAESAELTEMHFLGPMSLSAGTAELLTPEDMARPAPGAGAAAAKTKAA
ncbi:MAG TPA: hypothetical protein DIT64_00425 [Verrucomicrobiales bacterium]|nr:hypothetical protein [Verrucomicrobiales bacterium]